MALVKGAKRCYDWLKTKRAGEIVAMDEAMQATGWSMSSLRTYLTKNKLAPFLLELEGHTLKILIDGKELSERYFDEVFTQTAPAKVTLDVGTILAGRSAAYSLVEPLGNGAVGHVWSARNADDPRADLVAAKVMLPREDLLAASRIADVRERFRREAHNGQKIRHKHIVRYLDRGELRNNPFLVMELGSKSAGRVLKESGAMASNKAARIIRDVVEALSHLHDMSCPHRDVKPDNVLVFDDCYKLVS